MLRGSTVIAVIAASQMIVAGPLAAAPKDTTLRVAQAVVAELPPYETLAIVRSIGLRPIGQPMREGPNYVLRAIDRYGEERRVVLDARYGRVLDSVPVVRAPGDSGAPVVRLPGREFDDGEIDTTSPSPYPPRVIPAPHALAPAPRSAAVTPVKPPVPRPRPADQQQTAAAPALAAPPAPPAAKPEETKPAETKPVEAKPKVFVPDVTPLD